MPKRKDPESAEHEAAVLKKRAVMQKVGVDEAPDNSSSIPDAAKRHTSGPSAAEGIGSDQEEELSDAPQQQRKGKRKGEVEDMFAKLKKHRAAKTDEQALNKRILGKRKPAGSKDDIFGRGITKARRRDVEGFAIYSEDELGISKGGNTPQCPFDCECCF